MNTLYLSIQKCFLSTFWTNNRTAVSHHDMFLSAMKWKNTGTVSEFHCWGLGNTYLGSTIDVPVDPCNWEANSWIIKFRKIQFRPRETWPRKGDLHKSTSLNQLHYGKSLVLGYHMFLTKTAYSIEFPSPIACRLVSSHFEPQREISESNSHRWWEIGAFLWIWRIGKMTV